MNRDVQMINEQYIKTVDHPTSAHTSMLAMSCDYMFAEELG